jgi:hypothetical protein
MKANAEAKRLKKEQKNIAKTIFNLTEQLHKVQLDAAVHKIQRLYPNYINKDQIEICHKCDQKTINGFAGNKICKNGHRWRSCVHNGNFIGVRVGYKSSYGEYDFDEEDVPKAKS